MRFGQGSSNTGEIVGNIINHAMNRLGREGKVGGRCFDEQEALGYLTRSKKRKRRSQV